MIAGLYSASTNLDAIINQQDAISSNIANAGVSGHKAKTVVFRSFPELLVSKQTTFGAEGNIDNSTIGRVGTGVGVDWSYLNFTPGPAKETGVPTDLLVDGDGFFVVQNPNGEERYTRNSEFQLKVEENNTRATLTTKDGYPLMGDRGPVTVPVDQDFKIDAFGNVTAGNQTINKLRLITVPDKNVLMAESGAMFKVEKKWQGDIQDATETQVRQGYVEKSNVNTIVEMVRLIESYRNYESAARVISVLDRTLDLAVNQVGMRPA